MTYDDICKTLGEDLAACRRVRRMTIEELADRVGVSRQTIMRLEKGHPGVALGHLVAVVEIFGLEKNLREAFAPERDPEALRRQRLDLPERVRPKLDDDLGSLDF